jgi:hypothetical protein
MIRPLRRAHGVVMRTLAILVPVVLLAALMWQDPPPVQRPWTLGSVR